MIQVDGEKVMIQLYHDSFVSLVSPPSLASVLIPIVLYQGDPASRCSSPLRWDCSICLHDTSCEPGPPRGYEDFLETRLLQFLARWPVRQPAPAHRLARRSPAPDPGGVC